MRESQKAISVSSVGDVIGRAEDARGGGVRGADSGIDGFDSSTLSVMISQRQRDVLTHLCIGLSSKEIAWILGISLPAVKRAIQHLFVKFKVRNRTQLALAAERMKMLQAPVPMGRETD